MRLFVPEEDNKTNKELLPKYNIICHADDLFQNQPFSMNPTLILSFP